MFINKLENKKNQCYADKYIFMIKLKLLNKLLYIRIKWKVEAKKYKLHDVLQNNYNVPNYYC